MWYNLRLTCAEFHRSQQLPVVRPVCVRKTSKVILLVFYPYETKHPVVPMFVSPECQPIAVDESLQWVNPTGLPPNDVLNSRTTGVHKEMVFFLN